MGLHLFNTVDGGGSAPLLLSLPPDTPAQPASAQEEPKGILPALFPILPGPVRHPFVLPKHPRYISTMESVSRLPPYLVWTSSSFL